MGKIEITVSGAEAPDNGDADPEFNKNYNIVYLSGTLTISIDLSVIGTAIALAKNLKDGITTNERAAASVEVVTWICII